MSNLSWLRATIIGQWMTLVLWHGVAYYEARSLPYDLQIYSQRLGSSTANIGNILILFGESISLIAYTAATIGIVKTLRWSRPVYAYALVLAFFLSFFEYPKVRGPITDTLQGFALFLMGITWGILYFSPLSKLPHQDDSFPPSLVQK